MAEQQMFELSPTQAYEELMADHPYCQPVPRSKDVPFLGVHHVDKHVSSKEAWESIDHVELT